MSDVRCHFFFWGGGGGQSNEAYQWRVCFQRGLPGLVSITIYVLPSIWSFSNSHITAHDQDFQILQGASLPPPNSYINLSKNKTKYYTWQVTHGDWWHMVTQLPCSNGMTFMISWRLGGKGWLAEWMNEWMNQSINQSVTRLFVEQPRLHGVC